MRQRSRRVRQHKQRPIGLSAERSGALSERVLASNAHYAHSNRSNRTQNRSNHCRSPQPRLQFADCEFYYRNIDRSYCKLRLALQNSWRPPSAVTNNFGGALCRSPGHCKRALGSFTASPVTSSGEHWGHFVPSVCSFPWLAYFPNLFSAIRAVRMASDNGKPLAIAKALGKLSWLCVVAKPPAVPSLSLTHKLYRSLAMLRTLEGAQCCVCLIFRVYLPDW